MNREVDKEKDIHDGICLALFILFLFFLLIMICLLYTSDAADEL